MLKAYNTPGRLLAELWFLWSKKGELWGSARRRNHPFVHFFYSTMIYAIAAFVAYLWLIAWKIPRRETQDQSGYSAARDRTSVVSGKSLDVGVVLGGRCIIQT